MPTNVALTGLARDLAARAETGKPIRIGLVGAGEMGTDIVSRAAHMSWRRDRCHQRTETRCCRKVG